VPLIGIDVLIEHSNFVFFHCSCRVLSIVTLIVDVAFLFQVMEELRREESLTLDSSAASIDVTCTQPCESFVSSAFC